MIVALLTAISALIALVLGLDGPRRPSADTATGIALPDPTREGTTSVEAAIANRRSRREFSDDPMTLAEVGQLLWAAQGITARRSGFRAAPSAGATYPLEVYLLTGDPGVEGLDRGVYRYDPAAHRLERVRSGDHRAGLRAAALDQEWVGAGAVDIVITAIDERTTGRYGDRGRRRYVPMEAGHAGENLYLQAEALELSLVCVGAFRDEEVRSILDVSAKERPLSIYPVGRRL